MMLNFFFTFVFGISPNMAKHPYGLSSLEQYYKIWKKTKKKTIGLNVYNLNMVNSDPFFSPGNMANSGPLFPPPKKTNLCHQ
jgi:hypothetical protein